MGPNWYTGFLEMNHLHFVNSKISRIESNAFNAPAFHETSCLAFDEIDDLTLVPGWSNGLDSLNTLYISRTFVTNANEILLDPIGTKIVYFTYIALPDIFDLHELFGQIQLPKMLYVSIHCATKQYKHFGGNTLVDRILDSRSLAGLIEIRHLTLENCGIVAVREGTFDKFRRTIYSLHLERNQLKDLTINTFTAFFKSMSSNSQRRLVLIGNPLRCSCDYYELRNLSLMNPTIDFYYPDCHEDTEVPYEPLKCRRSQILRPREHCFQISKFNLFTHPLIEFRNFENATGKYIHLQSETSGYYEMFVVNTDDSMPSIKCILLPNGTSIIPMSQFNYSSAIVSFFIIFNTNPALVWPLNYHSIRVREMKIQKMELNWSNYQNLFICVFVLWLFVSYLIGVVAYKCSESRVNVYEYNNVFIYFVC